MKHFGNTWILISRIIVGSVFVFSGFVKGADPLGTAYRIEDYFIAFHIQQLTPLALLLSIALCTFEFTIGILLLFNIRGKLVSWLLFLIMLFFTFTTLYDAIYNPVPDCGCFGEAIKLTNWQTFYKNIILLLPVCVIFFGRNKFKTHFPENTTTLIGIITVLLFISFSLYNYFYLPVIDFLPWKVGNKVYSENLQAQKIYLIYKNKKTGERKEYLSPDFPYNDSVWMASWEFVSQRIESKTDNNTPVIQITDTTGTNVTDNFLRNPDYQFIIVAYDLDNTHLKAFNKINQLAMQAQKDGYSFIALYSMGNINSFVKKSGANYDFYAADDIILKMLVRANPGLLLLKNGIMIDKWHYLHIPDYSDIKKEFLIK